MSVGVDVFLGDLRSGPDARRTFNTKLVFAELQVEVTGVSSPEGTPRVGDDPGFDFVSVLILGVGPANNLDDVVDVGFASAVGEDTRGLLEAPLPDRTGVDTTGDRTTVVDFSFHLFNTQNLTEFFDTPNGVVGDGGTIVAGLTGGAVAATVVSGAFAAPTIGGVLEAGGIGDSVLMNVLHGLIVTSSSATGRHTVDDVLNGNANIRVGSIAVDLDAVVEGGGAAHGPAGAAVVDGSGEGGRPAFVLVEVHFGHISSLAVDVTPIPSARNGRIELGEGRLDDGGDVFLSGNVAGRRALLFDAEVGVREGVGKSQREEEGDGDKDGGEDRREDLHDWS